MSALDRLEQRCRAELDERALRVALVDELRRSVPCDAHAWLLTDPSTWVGASPLAEVPTLDDLPTLIRLKYLTRVNRWTGLPPCQARSLVEATGGDRARSSMWSELLAGYGIDDVLSVALVDPHGCWGFLDLWRVGGRFTAPERDLLSGLAALATPAIRRSLVRAFDPGGREPEPSGEPVVLLLGDDLRPLAQTPGADACLRALLPTAVDRAPVPAAALNVGAQLLAVERGVSAHPPSARVHLHGGRWVTLRAARLVGRGGIAVTVESTPPAPRAELYGRVLGLSRREAELLGHLVAGCDTRELARRMFVSPHTVQDHLKSIFAKSGARSRRVLIARATGATSEPPVR